MNMKCEKCDKEAVMEVGDKSLCQMHASLEKRAQKMKKVQWKSRNASQKAEFDAITIRSGNEPENLDGAIENIEDALELLKCIASSFDGMGHSEMAENDEMDS